MILYCGTPLGTSFQSHLPLHLLQLYQISYPLFNFNFIINKIIAITTIYYFIILMLMIIFSFSFNVINDVVISMVMAMVVYLIIDYKIISYLIKLFLFILLVHQHTLHLLNVNLNIFLLILMDFP
jgi:hypothetical protein